MLLTGVGHAIEEAADLISKDTLKKFPTMPLREGELAEDVLLKKIDAFYTEIMGETKKE